MKFKGIRRVGSRIKFGYHKHKSQIWLVTGLTAMVGSIPFWVKSTLKMHDVLDQAKIDVDAIKNNADLTEKEAQKETFKVVGKTAWEGLKTYALPLTLTTFGGVSICVSNRILNEKNAALAGACASIETGFREYRKRVVDKYGKEEDFDLMYDTKIDKIETDEDGKKLKKPIERKYVDREYVARTNSFEVFFDESNSYYEKTPGLNLAFISTVLKIVNDRLDSNRYIFLADVKTLLGFERELSPIDFQYGWIKSNDPDHRGDNHIDFGIYNMNREEKKLFLNGNEPAILLTFNVDPEPILYSDKLPGILHY